MTMSKRSSREHYHKSESPLVSFGRPPLHPHSKKSRSILHAIMKTASWKGSRSKLSRLEIESIEREQVKYLPPAYDGDKIFELPPLPEGIPTQFGGGMDGMSKQYDGHTWYKTMTTNIISRMSMVLRIVSPLYWTPRMPKRELWLHLQEQREG